MKRYTPDELNEVLRLHKLWAQDEEVGQRANLQRADLRCADLQKLLHPDSFADEGSCATCVDESRKAAMCSQYRTTYNSILETKKLLEFLGVGTITSSDNRRNILQDGWKLVLFENVRLEVKK